MIFTIALKIIKLEFFIFAYYQTEHCFFLLSQGLQSNAWLKSAIFEVGPLTLFGNKGKFNYNKKQLNLDSS